MKMSQEATGVNSATGGAATPPSVSSPTASSGSSMFGRLFKTKTPSNSKTDDVPASPPAPPSPSALMSPGAGKARENRGFQQRGLLGEQYDECVGRKCLVLDLDETLVHSSFKPTKNADFIIPVEIDGITHQVYVGKRPHVDEFLSRMGKIYEIVVFTASLSKVY